MRALAFLLLTLLTTTPALADAPTWTIDPTTSTLAFTGTQEGTEFKGTFQKFTADIKFDEKDLEHSSIKVTVDTASAHTGDKTYDGSLPGTDWFNAAEFPEAVFESKKITANPAADKDGVANYIADGTLTILGVTKNITLPFGLKTEGPNTHAFGEITLKRLDFGLGVNADGKGEWVGNDVKVRFDLMAHK